MPRQKQIARLELPKPTKRRRALEWSKNFLIAILSVTAIYLAGRCQLYSGTVYGAQGGWLSTFLRAMQDPTGTQTMEDSSGRPMETAARLALCSGATDGQGNVARYGIQYDAAGTKKLADAVSFHLSAALAGARAPRVCTEQQWRDALEGPGIYVELLGAVPLRVLNAWQKESTPNAALPEGVGTRRFLLAYRSGENATFYYINENDGLYYACETTVAYEGAGGLKEKIASELTKNAPNWATFAFEQQESEAYEALDPYVMITDPPPSRIYRSGNPIPLHGERQAELQRVLSFPFGYEVNSGVVIGEGNEKLRLSTDGVATYQAAEQAEPRYPVKRGETETDEAAMIAAARRVAEATVGAWCGAATLYLKDISAQADGSWQVRFDYSLNGSAVILPHGAVAAAFIIRAGRIDAFTLHFRVYEETGETASVLPVNQAVAAMRALHPAGRTLVLCYQDSEDGRIYADWAAR